MLVCFHIRGPFWAFSPSLLQNRRTHLPQEAPLAVVAQIVAVAPNWVSVHVSVWLSVCVMPLSIHDPVSKTVVRPASAVETTVTSEVAAAQLWVTYCVEMPPFTVEIMVVVL
jgi:hypothetical protein